MTRSQIARTFREAIRHRIALPAMLAAFSWPVKGAALGHQGSESTTRTTALRSKNDHVAPLIPPKRTATRMRPNRVHDGHYLFGPSAIGMEGGSGYYQNQDVVMHSAYFTPTDGLTFGGGVQLTSLFSSIASGGHGPMYHVRVNGGGPVRDGLHIGGFAMGLQLGKDIKVNDQLSLPTRMGLGAAQATFETERFNISLAGGVSLDQNGLGDGPLLMLAGLWHLTSRTSVITESWNIPFATEQYRVYMYGARFTHRGMSCDVAFAYNDDLSKIFFLGAPVLGFALRFGGETLATRQ